MNTRGGKFDYSPMRTVESVSNLYKEKYAYKNYDKHRKMIKRFQRGSN